MSKHLLKSGIIVSTMTLISRILGVMRDIVIASLVGSSMNADVFFFANKIPNFLRRLFAEGAFSQAFIPILTEYYKYNNIKKTRELISVTSGTLGLIVLIVTIFGVLGSSILTALFGIGWFIDWLTDGPEAKKFELANCMLKITFPYLWFITFVALSGAILNTMGKFSVSAFTPVFLNVILIGFAWFVSPNMDQPEIGLAIGIFCGGLFQCLFQLPFLIKEKLLVKPKWNWNYPGLIQIRTLMIPALFGVSVSQINLLFDTLIASFLSTGSISWMYYANRLFEFPLGLFGVAIATIILPTLSRSYLNSQSKIFTSTVDWGVRMVTLFGVPAMLGLMVLSKPLLIVLFMRGEFTLNDVHNTSLSLLAYSSGLINCMLIKVFASGYYSRQNTRAPVKYGIISMLFNIILNLILSWFYGYLGLAISTALSAFVNMFLLYKGLYLQGVYQLTKQTVFLICKIILASCFMGIILFYQLDDISIWLTLHIFDRVVSLCILIILGIFSYLVSIFFLGIRLKDFKSITT
ncbi:membrane protein [Candidatus Photodesmus katoptron]|uniref:murein biosynthesis integral membrane protein MurJ n=1 Tax=Candidatus Photodesmus anomalopis TaxID=28176 RepID=UPI0004D52C02|nr:murein biosynthesis integral membrane protein MurJ [Candidatus Photodesmus katoptron]KEY90027.1 membrane protein [Candidatus Photodesmus katoptron]